MDDAAHLAKVADDAATRRLIREIVLQTVVEMDSVRKIGEVRSFLDSCAARGIRLGWNEEKGKLTCNNYNAMTSELRAVLIVMRKDITAFLQRMQDQEKAAEQRRRDYEIEREARRNGKPK